MSKIKQKHILWSTIGHRSIIPCGYSCYLYTDTQYHSKKKKIFVNLKGQRLPNIVFFEKIQDLPLSPYKVNVNVNFCHGRTNLGQFELKI